jgi:hypothetical protein
MTRPPDFTILLPVNRPPHMLPYAVGSILRQSRQDFELFIICDGAPPETADCARDFAARDSRIRAFVHPKGERYGELYRHQALEHASGRYVCQIGDDDLWLPNHLAQIARLLEDVDFGNVVQVQAKLDGGAIALTGDLADPETRQRMLQGFGNFFGPTASGYRLAAYRALPVGWSPAPPTMSTDLHMWQKFLRREGLRFGTRQVATSLKFAAPGRRGWPMERRAAEIAGWVARLERCDEDGALQLVNRAMFDTAAQHARREQRLRAKLAAMRSTASWRLTRPFRRLRRLFRRKAD